MVHVWRLPPGHAVNLAVKFRIAQRPYERGANIWY
jgi:hypothetical protein